MLAVPVHIAVSSIIITAAGEGTKPQLWSSVIRIGGGTFHSARYEQWRRTLAARTTFGVSVYNVGGITVKYASMIIEYFI